MDILDQLRHLRSFWLCDTNVSREHFVRDVDQLLSQERARPDTDLTKRIVDALFERGRKASSGEPLFFDEHNMRLIVERELAARASSGPQICVCGHSVHAHNVPGRGWACGECSTCLKYRESASSGRQEKEHESHQTNGHEGNPRVLEVGGQNREGGQEVAALDASRNQTALNPSPEPDVGVSSSAQLDTETETELRCHLWASHGHQGIYGDDGEMQCAECGALYRFWDYRRAPLADVIKTGIKARIDANMRLLAKARKESPSVPPSQPHQIKGECVMEIVMLPAKTVAEINGIQVKFAVDTIVEVPYEQMCRLTGYHYGHLSEAPDATTPQTEDTQK